MLMCSSYNRIAVPALVSLYQILSGKKVIHRSHVVGFGETQLSILTCVLFVTKCPMKTLSNEDLDIISKILDDTADIAYTN